MSDLLGKIVVVKRPGMDLIGRVVDLLDGNACRVRLLDGFNNECHLTVKVSDVIVTHRKEKDIFPSYDWDENAWRKQRSQAPPKKKGKKQQEEEETWIDEFDDI